MSWWFLQQALGYVVEASRCTPESLRSLTNRMRMQVLSTLPASRACDTGRPASHARRPESLLEMYRGPLHNPPTRERLFRIPDENLFYLDLVTGDVPSAGEARARYHECLLERLERQSVCKNVFRSIPRSSLLPEPAGQDVVWMVLDAPTHACQRRLGTPPTPDGDGDPPRPPSCT